MIITAKGGRLFRPGPPNRPNSSFDLGPVHALDAAHIKSNAKIANLQKYNVCEIHFDEEEKIHTTELFWIPDRSDVGQVRTQLA